MPVLKVPLGEAVVVEEPPVEVVPAGGRAEKFAVAAVSAVTSTRVQGLVAPEHAPLQPVNL
jgi:hypothetical protein